MNLLLQIFFFLGLGYLGIAGFMYWRQDSLVFYPPKATHEDVTLRNVERFSFSRNGHTVRGWFVNPLHAREKIIIYYGGNGEDVFHNVDEYDALQAASLFVAYRGYGPSDGFPGEAGIFLDALGVFDEIRVRFPDAKIFLVGRSLGSGVACYVGAKRDVDGVVLVTPYDSLAAVAQSAYPWLPVSYLLRHRFESIRYVESITAPLLVFYGGGDRVVRPARTRNLLRYIKGENKVVYLEKAEHGNIDMYPEYWQELVDFINMPVI